MPKSIQGMEVCAVVNLPLAWLNFSQAHSVTVVLHGDVLGVSSHYVWTQSFDGVSNEIGIKPILAW